MLRGNGVDVPGRIQDDELMRPMSEPPAIPPERIRVTDADRQVVAERLRRAHDEASLTLDEYDERLIAVWSAKTRGDLGVLTADLPPDHIATRPVAPTGGATVAPRGASPASGGGRTALRVLALIWLIACLVNFVVWGLVCVTNVEFYYPWFLWVVVPPGAILGGLWWSLYGRRRPGA